MPVSDTTTVKAPLTNLTIGMLLVMHTLVHVPLFIRLLDAWRIKPQCSHGWFVLPIAVWLCMGKRRELAVAPQVMTPFGLIPFSAGLISYLCAQAAGLQTAANLAWMMSLAGLLVTLLGSARFRKVLFPFLFLVFMFPIPDFLYLALTASLKLAATALATALIASLGMAVIRDGNIIHLPSFRMDVVDACSGMQSLVSFLMLGILLAYILKGSFPKKALVVAASVPVAFCNNVLRIAITGVLGELWGERGVTGLPHEMLGIGLFLMGFMMLAVLYRLLSGKGQQAQDSGMSLGAGACGGN